MAELSGSIDYIFQPDEAQPSNVSLATYALVLPPVFALPPVEYQKQSDENIPSLVTPPPMLAPIPGFSVSGSAILPSIEPPCPPAYAPPTTGQLWPRGNW